MTTDDVEVQATPNFMFQDCVFQSTSLPPPPPPLLRPPSSPTGSSIAFAHGEDFHNSVYAFHHLFTARHARRRPRGRCPPPPPPPYYCRVASYSGRQCRPISVSVSHSVARPRYHSLVDSFIRATFVLALAVLGHTLTVMNAIDNDGPPPPPRLSETPAQVLAPVPVAHQQRTVSVIVSPNKASVPPPCHPAVDGLQLFSSLEILNRTYEEQIRYVYSNMRTAAAIQGVCPSHATHKYSASVLRGDGACTNGNQLASPSSYGNQSLTTTATALPGQNRMSYPREFKLLAVKYYYENGRNKYRTCKVFQITKSMLNGWLEKVDKIQQSRPGSLKSGRSGRKPQFPDVERELFDIYRVQLQEGRKVGNRWLRETAKLIAQRKCKPDELNGMCQFSERWLCNFKKRYSINLTKDWSYNLTNGSAAVRQQQRQQQKPGNDLPDSSQTGNNSVITSGDGRIRQSSMTETCPDDGDGFVPKRAHLDYIEDLDPAKDAISDETISCSNQISNSGATSTSSVNLNNKELQSSTVTNGCGKSSTGTEHSKRGRKVQFPEVEAMLHKRLFEQRSKGARITNRWLQDEARRLASELCPKTFNDAFKSARCMFSEHWLHNFKKRYGISLKQNLHGPPPPPTTTSFPTETTTAVTTSVTDGTAAVADCCNEGELKPLYLTTSYGDLVDLSQPNNRVAHDRMDDLPTMVPIRPFARRATDFSILEWYSRISNTVSQSMDESPRNLTNPIAV